MMKNPIEVIVNGRLFRQLFPAGETFFILPGRTSQRIVSCTGLALPIVEIKDKIGPFSSKQTNIYGKPILIEEAVYNALDKLMKENPKVKEMNGIFFLEANRYAWKRKIASREYETMKFDLMRYELTDRVLFTTLTPEGDFEKPYKL